MPTTATDVPDDATLVMRCLRDDAAAWAAFVHRYQRLVYAVARRVGLDDHAAADVFQTVFERLLKQLSRIADPSRLQAWIVTTTKREALLQRERGRRHVSTTVVDEAGDALPSSELADDAPIAEDVLDDLQQLHAVRTALERLDPRCRDLLLMLFSDEEDRRSYDDIARALNIATGSIGPTRARCLDKLRTLHRETT